MELYQYIKYQELPKNKFSTFEESKVSHWFLFVLCRYMQDHWGDHQVSPVDSLGVSSRGIKQ